MSNSASTEHETQEVDGLWTAIDAAKYLRVTRDWIYRHSVSGVLPAHYIGPNLRFVPGELKAWATGQANESKVVRLPASKPRPPKGTLARPKQTLTKPRRR